MRSRWCHPAAAVTAIVWQGYLLSIGKHIPLIQTHRWDLLTMSRLEIYTLTLE